MDNAKATQARRRRVFIAYRQGTNEGDGCAKWLHSQITGALLDSEDGDRAAVETYLDVRSPALGD